MRGLSPRLRVSLLNGFRLWRNNELIPLPQGEQRLLAFVALHDGPLPRLQVAGTLWPDASEQRSNGSLRSTLWRLRQAACQLVRTTPRHVQLDDGVSVDFREASQAAQRLLAGPPGGEVELSPALEDAGDLLVGWYEDWVILERERYHQRRLRALEVLCRRLTDAGRYPEAVQAGLAAVSAEPLRETARRVLIQACLAEGNYAQALQQYRSYREVLQDELGLEPSPRINALIATLTGANAALNWGIKVDSTMTLR